MKQRASFERTLKPLPVSLKRQKGQLKLNLILCTDYSVEWHYGVKRELDLFQPEAGVSTFTEIPFNKGCLVPAERPLLFLACFDFCNNGTNISFAHRILGQMTRINEERFGKK